MPISSSVRSVPRIMLLLCFLLCAGNAVGWIFDLPLLVSLFAALPRMVPLTMLLLAVAAANCWMLLEPPGKADRSLALALLVTAAGLAVLTAHALGAAPGPFMIAGRGVQTAWALPSPPTAAMLAVTGLAQVLFLRGRAIAAAQAGVMTVLLVALLNLGGYFAQGTRLYEVLPGQGVSVLTSIALMLLSCAGLSLRPHDGIMRVFTGSTPSARIARHLMITALAVPLGVVVVVSETLEAHAAGTAILLPLIAWSTIVLLMLIIWRFAFQLYHVDIARTQAEQGLGQALQDLQREREHKDVFMATLAHELRNPLAPIQLSAQLMRRQAGTLEATRLSEMADVILRQVAHMNGMVNDLLDMSRIAQGKILLAHEPVDLREVVRAALEQVQPLIERKRQQMQAALPQQAIMVAGDRQRLVQVVANLLNNAAKYTPEEGRLAIALSTSGALHCLSVQDSGIGIDAALLPHIFEPFTQAALTSEREGGGLGLGLGLAQRLAELHGGGIRARSAGRGQGSEFTLSLPVLGD